MRERYKCFGETIITSVSREERSWKPNTNLSRRVNKPICRGARRSKNPPCISTSHSYPKYHLIGGVGKSLQMELFMTVFVWLNAYA